MLVSRCPFFLDENRQCTIQYTFRILAKAPSIYFSIIDNNMGVENTICSTSPAKKRARLSLKKCSQAAKNDSTTGETENTK